MKFLKYFGIACLIGLLPLVCLLSIVGGCTATHDTGRIPDLPTQRSEAVATGKLDTPTAPVLPANPTHREYKAYKKAVAAYKAIEVAKAKAAAGPSKIKVKGGSSLAQPGGTSTNNYQAGKKADSPVAVGEQAAADDHSTDARPTFWSGLGKSIPWVVLVLVVTLIGYVLRRLDII